MTLIYEIIDNEFGSQILKATDKEGKEFWIPLDEGNSDYQAYLNPMEHLTSPLSDLTA